MATQTDVRELTVESGDGASLHVEVHGRADAPAIVLAHGWTCSTVFWAPVARELAADGYRVVLYDQRGHGRSAAASPKAYSPAGLADDLCAVLSATLAPGERAVVGGHSMGGMTIMAAAGRRELQEHAAALLLCSTGAQNLLVEARVLPFPSPRLRGFAHRMVLGASAPLGPISPITKKALKYGTMGRGSSPEQILAVARLVHACPPRIRAAWGKVLAGLDLAANVGRLTAPTAVVVGTEDRLTPVPHAHELARSLPNCTQTRVLPGLGHMVPIEDPGAVAAVLRGLAGDRLTAAAGESAGTTKEESP